MTTTTIGRVLQSLGLIALSGVIADALGASMRTTGIVVAITTMAVGTLLAELVGREDAGR